jgi:hypothetical protein
MIVSRLVGRVKAAEYCDLSPKGYDEWVRKGILPPPIPGTTKYDLRAIDLRLDGLSGISSTPTNAKSTEPDDGFDEWMRREGYAS